MDKQTIQIMACYSAVQRNELPGHEKSCRNLQCIVLSEKSQPEKAAFFMILTMLRSGKDKTRETVKRPVVGRTGG